MGFQPRAPFNGPKQQGYPRHNGDEASGDAPGLTKPGESVRSARQSPVHHLSIVRGISSKEEQAVYTGKTMEHYLHPLPFYASKALSAMQPIGNRKMVGAIPTAGSSFHSNEWRRECDGLASLLVKQMERDRNPYDAPFQACYRTSERHPLQPG